MAIGAGEDQNKSMRLYRPYAAEAAFAQPLTEEILTSPRGYRLGCGSWCSAEASRTSPCSWPSVSGRAERSSPRTTTPEVVAEARRRAADECFDRVTFLAEPFERLRLDALADAVVGRFFLMHESRSGRNDPARGEPGAATAVASSFRSGNTIRCSGPRPRIGRTYRSIGSLRSDRLARFGDAGRTSTWGFA